MNIVLIGFMGTGKTVLGKILAKSLKMEFIDTDSLIEEKDGKSVARIFCENGERYFRKLERDVIKVVSRKNNAVISTGGGVVLSPGNMKQLRRNGVIICLKSKPEVILKRIKRQKGIRPLLNKPDPLKEIRSLLRERAPYYKQADFVIDTSHLKKTT